MHLRAITIDDVLAYVALRREMLRADPWAFAASEEADVACDAVKLRERMAEPGQMMVGAFDADCAQAAQPGAPLLGAAALVRHRHAKMAHRAEIFGVYVTPSARSQGLGRLLIRAVIEHATSWHGVDSVALSVSERALPAQRLYERCGFVAWGREPGALKHDGVAYDEIHMVRML